MRIVGSRDRFALTKWYFDVVDAEGRAAIAYRVRLSWRGLALSWQDVSLFEPCGAVRHRSSLIPTGSPTRRGRHLSWRPSVSSGGVEGDVLHPSTSRMLFQRGRAAVEWRCLSPAARLRIGCSTAPAVTGLGYAECLTMTTAPWRLPIKELRWGRWISSDGSHSLVWIRWSGPRPLALVFLNGALLVEPAISDRRIRAAELDLRLTPVRTLRERSLGQIVEPIRAVSRLVPKSFLSLQETKWLSTGRLLGGPETGWAIHERVTFR
jgi:hypothetical protein